MNPKLVGAVRELVEAVLVEHCLPVAGDEGLWNEAHSRLCPCRLERDPCGARTFFAAQLGR